MTSPPSSKIVERNNTFARLIFDYEHQRIVGLMGFTALAADPQTVLLGLAVDPAHRRQGYGKAALRIGLDTAQTAPDVHALHIDVPANHTIAAHLASSFGFAPLAPSPDDGAQVWVLDFV